MVVAEEFISKPGGMESVMVESVTVEVAVEDATSPMEEVGFACPVQPPVTKVLFSLVVVAVAEALFTR